jgi:hypothetical protein
MDRLRSKICAASRLSWADRMLFFRDWVLLFTIDLSLRIFSFKHVQEFLSRRWKEHASRAPEQTINTITHMKKILSLARRNHLYPMTCLRYALALQTLLCQLGIQSDLRFGVIKEGDDLNAHAWLEMDGTPISEPERITSRFSPLNPFTSAKK